jgi:hypothetical protein
LRGVLPKAAFCCAFFLWAKGLNAKGIHKDMFSLYSGKCLRLKSVHNWVENFSQRRSKVGGDTGSIHHVEIATEATVLQAEELIRADRRITIDSVVTALGCMIV